ncbi:MAG TPA: DUF6152 family protein [Micropepsaceae bacterium]|nr:DUF6152 family protein [Micropepsaceae bacterium]
MLPALALLCATAAPAFGHHADIMFAPDKTMTLSSTMKSFEYANPHSTIVMTGAEKGARAMQWTIETDSPVVLKKVGIASDTLHPGDKVTVMIHPLKDGTAGGSLVELKRDDGMLFIVQKPGAFGPRTPVVGTRTASKTKPAG